MARLMQGEILDFTRQLVETPSQNGTDSEAAVANLVADKLRGFGFEPEIIGSKAHPSVICHVKKAGGGKTVWLESCLDTVPAGDESKWSHPPFSAEIEQGRMYGRGVADCKVGVALFCYLAKELAGSNDFNDNLFLGFDADEQGGAFTGIKEVMKYSPKADICILGYQGNDAISIGARGWYRLKLTTLGEAAHTGSASKRGINAVHYMAKAVNALLDVDIQTSEPFFEFGTSLQVTKVHGGEIISVVPDKCEAFVDIRWLPSQKQKDILAKLKEALDSLKPQASNFNYTLEELQCEPAYLTDPNHPFVQILKNEAKKILGREVPLRASSQGSVGNVISKSGTAIINAFGCESGNVHAPDEWIAVQSIPKTLEIYKRALTKFTK